MRRKNCGSIYVQTHMLHPSQNALRIEVASIPQRRHLGCVRRRSFAKLDSIARSPNAMKASSRQTASASALPLCRRCSTATALTPLVRERRHLTLTSHSLKFQQGLDSSPSQGDTSKSRQRLVGPGRCNTQNTRPCVHKLHHVFRSVRCLAHTYRSDHICDKTGLDCVPTHCQRGRCLR